MNTACQPCVCVPVPQREHGTTIKHGSSAVRRIWESLMATRRTRLGESQLASLDGLSAETLKDIGAPEWLQAQAFRSQERAHQGGLLERDTLHWR